MLLIVEIKKYGLRENLGERACLEDPGIDGKIALRLVFRKWDVGAWTG
jgi:hypothetical protein